MLWYARRVIPFCDIPAQKCTPRCTLRMSWWGKIRQEKSNWGTVNTHTLLANVKVKKYKVRDYYRLKKIKVWWQVYTIHDVWFEFFTGKNIQRQKYRVTDNYLSKDCKFNSFGPMLKLLILKFSCGYMKVFVLKKHINYFSVNRHSVTILLSIDSLKKTTDRSIE